MSIDDFKNNVRVVNKLSLLEEIIEYLLKTDKYHSYEYWIDFFQPAFDFWSSQLRSCDG